MFFSAVNLQYLWVWILRTVAFTAVCIIALNEKVVNDGLGKILDRDATPTGLQYITATSLFPDLIENVFSRQWKLVKWHKYEQDEAKSRLLAKSETTATLLCWNMGFRVQHCTLLFYLSYICGVSLLFYLHFCGTLFSICIH